MSERDKPKEPQSYGSEKDWVEGNTDQTVQNTPGRTSRHDEDHYEDRHDDGPTETPDPNAQQSIQPESAAGAVVVGEGGKKISESNERRRNEGFFRERDYS